MENTSGTDSEVKNLARSGIALCSGPNCYYSVK